MVGRSSCSPTRSRESTHRSRSIREGRFLNALIREESREDETWVISLRNLPDAPETYYLMELMASHDFQTALQNYLDLEELRSKFIAGKTSLDAFDDIIRLRGQNYEPLLPEADAQFRELDSRIRLRLEQHKHLAERLKAILTAPRPDYLATAEERIAAERIALIEKQLGDSDNPELRALRQRAARLRGALTWRLETEYNERLTAAYVHLNELNAPVDALSRQYDAFVRTRQAATQSYVGYDVQIARLRERVGRRIAACRSLDSPAGTHDRDRCHQPARGAPGTLGRPAESRRATGSPIATIEPRGQPGGRTVMRRLAIPTVVAPVFIVGCAARPNKPVGTAGTLAELRNVRPDVQEAKVEQGLDQAMHQYRRFLEETPETAMTPEAMRRLADLQIEKQFGIRTGNAKPREMAAPKPAQVLAGSQPGSPNPAAGSCCTNPIRISSGARQRRPESWRVVTPAPRRRTRCALAQIPTVHSRRSLSMTGC